MMTHEEMSRQNTKVSMTFDGETFRELLTTNMTNREFKESNTEGKI